MRIQDTHYFNFNCVFLEILNVALRREAVQSSTSSAEDAILSADLAVDGKSFISGNMCSLTADGDTDPWWMVDLGQLLPVIAISAKAHIDCCKFSSSLCGGGGGVVGGGGRGNNFSSINYIRHAMVV